MMLTIETIPVTPFTQNARVLYTHDGGDCVVIDPGGDAELIASFMSEHHLTCKEIWLTHSHLDHCGGVAELKEKSGAKLLGHPIEREMRAHVLQIAEMYGMPPGDMRNCPEPDRYITGGEKLDFNGEKFESFFTPGHAPGHIVFYHRPSGVLIAGDTLFQGSIGRTDLPGGNHAQLIKSIRSQILTLPDNTLVMPGHGSDTTVGEERRTNPYLIN